MTTKDEARPKRRVRIKAEYAAMLLPFIGTEFDPARLRGIHVHPHPEGGVVLVATNDRIMAVIYDGSGQANGSWICPIPAALSLSDTRHSISRLHFHGNIAHATRSDLPLDADFVDFTNPNHAGSYYAPPIDETFSRRWPEPFNDFRETGATVTLNPDLLEPFSLAAKLRGCAFSPQITIRTQGPFAAIMVEIHNIPEFLGAIMPLNIEKPNWSRPYWFTSLCAALPSEGGSK
ncbi:MAG: hypothetical protein HQL41_05935 [Alphaproteobacteria bacterium]|nr:hypothetical protein [Alphaproteobacteria bacterium]